MTDPQPPSGARSAFQQTLRAAGRNLGWLLASRGLLAVLSLFYLGIAARTLGVVDFGRFALISGASQALAIFVTFQTWQIIVQYGVGHLIEGDEGALGRLLRLCGILDLGSAIAGAGISVVILTLFGATLGIEPDLMPIVMLFSVVQLLALRSTPVGILRLRNKFAVAAFADSMTPVIRFAGALLAWWLSPTIEGFLYGWTVAEIVTAGTYWILIARGGDLGLMVRARLDRGRLAAENPGLLRMTLSTNASSTLNLSGKQIPLLFVGAFAGPAAAGAFRMAFQIAQALAKLSQLLSRAAFPEIVRAVRTSGVVVLKDMIGKLIVGSAGGGLVILAVIALAGQTVLTLVGGAEYAPAYPILLWLAAAGCVDLAIVSFEPILMAMHRAGTAFIARAVATAVMLGAMSILAPLYAGTGAAIAMLIGSLASAILLGAAIFGRLGGATVPPAAPDGSAG